MSTASSSLSRIRARVESLHQKHDRSRVFGIRLFTPLPIAERAEVNGRECFFNWCDSVLQIRELLVAREKDESLQVVLTNLTDTDLGQDLLARFARQHFFTDDVWQTLEAKFKAHRTDPSLRKQRWLAEMILEHAPPAGHPPATSGVLDAETVWGIVLKEQFGFASARPDARDLLEWTMQLEQIERYSQASAEFKQGLRKWLRQSAGPVGEAIFDCLDAGAGKDAVPIGLACEVVFNASADAAIKAELHGAAIRMERYAAGRSLAPVEAEAWRNASAGLIDRLSREAQQSVVMRALDRADEILSDLRIGGYAYLSPHSPAGFEQALEQYGRRLLEICKSGTFAEAMDGLMPLADVVFHHRQAFDGKKRSLRAETVEMSLRLLRWLAVEPAAYGGFDEAASAYARDGGFVDRARHALHKGDGAPSPREAYARLADLAGERREAENRQFAQLLAKWLEAGSRGKDVMKIEDVLQQVVAEAVRSLPVLLVVMDGMGYAVFRELLEQISDRGWIEIAPKGKAWPRPVIAALPSITEFSRASLLCGKLTNGLSANEAAGFESNEALRGVSGKKPPMLFHKNRLTEAGRNELAADLREALASEKQRIVGVVVNAVDDHLHKGDQLNVPWTLDSISILDHLLYAARDAGRAVILTADHGHILDRQTVYRPPVSSTLSGERYRGADPAPEADELLVSGRRVIPGKIIAPWSESVRYTTSKKHGYHGGLTPQECVVPCAVLIRYNQKRGDGQPGDGLEDWDEPPLYQPVWWSRSQLAPVALPALQTKKSRKTSGTTMPLFGDAEARDAGWPELTDWLFKSEVYASQHKLAGRGAPKLDDARKFLEVLARGGGAVLKQTMAQQLGIPELRIAGMIATMRRVLNVDGYPVLDVEEPSGTIRLNLELLKLQFGLDENS